MILNKTRDNEMNTIVLATGNAGKIRELAAMLAEQVPDIQVLGLSDFPMIGDIPETGETFEENARIKAVAVARATGLVAVADDSGLAVDALGGAPGVYSARYSGEGATDQKNVDKLLDALADVPDAGRGCHFACVMLAATPGGIELIGRGAWHGRVAWTPAGSGGFGYDPVFFDEKLGMTAAQMEAQVKNARSHRGLALRDLLRGWPEFWKKAQLELEK
jgi:XTP/dITP diphosphohydrolase